jgi:carbon storage regulator
MLVLSRREGEKILIGDAVITLIAVGGNRARIGIDAPSQVHVVREEIRDRQPASNEDVWQEQGTAPRPR